MFDPHLSPVLTAATSSELQPIIELLEQKSIAWKANPSWSPDRLRLEIDQELRLNGGNSFVNLFRGQGPSWAEIVEDVAKRVGVEHTSNTIVLEERITFKLFEQVIAKMSSEQLKEFREELKKAGLPVDIPLAQGALLIAMAAGKLGGFATYQLLVIVANAIVKVLIGRGLGFAVNTALTRLLAVAFGPIGWGVALIWTAIDIAGPAMRITIPAVIMVASLRAQQKTARSVL
jgi:uncharacterized protein YaaW (UPF0174 family)